MKAAVYNTFNGAIEIKQVDDPVVTETEAIIEVRARGMSFDFIYESYPGGNELYQPYVPKIGYRHYNIEETRYVRFGSTPILEKSVLGFESAGDLHFPIW